MAFKFKGVDFLRSDSLLSEDELLTRNTALSTLCCRYSRGADADKA
jgi:hypothetical protein